MAVGRQPRQSRGCRPGHGATSGVTRPTHVKGDTIVYGPIRLIGVSDARDLHAAARKLVLEGSDPKGRAREAKRATADTFGQVAARYLAKQIQLKPRTIAKARWQLRGFLIPEIGQKPIDEMLQQCSDWLGSLCASRDVVALRRK